MSIENLSAAAQRLYLAADPLIVMLQNRKTELANMVIQSSSNLTGALAAAVRAEAAAASSGGGGGTPTPGNTLALLHLDEAAAGTRPMKWANAVVGGAEFYNYGYNASLGARAQASGFFGSSGYGESVSSGQTAVTSAIPFNLTGDFTIEGFLDRMIQDNSLCRLASLDGNQVVNLMGVKPTNDAVPAVRLTAYIGGVYNAETSAQLPAVAIGATNGYHYAIVRKSGKIKAYVNGKLVATLPGTFNDALNVYADMFGSYDREDGYAQGAFYATFAELRLSSVARYDGNTYVIPSAKFTL